MPSAPHYHNQALTDKVLKLFEGKDQKIGRFVRAYGEYVEVIDDLVDEPKDIALIQKMTSLATALFSSDYWRERGHMLRLVEQTINLTYFVSVKWETSGDSYLRREARALSHCGYNMLFAVLILECGAEAAQSIAAEFMESCHNHHKDDPI